jgi:hypothetical protein
MFLLVSYSILINGCSNEGAKSKEKNAIEIIPITKDESLLLSGLGFGTYQRMILDKEMAKKIGINKIIYKYRIVKDKKVIKDDSMGFTYLDHIKGNEPFVTSIVNYKEGTYLLNMGNKSNGFISSSVNYYAGNNTISYRSIEDSIPKIELNKDYVLNYVIEDDGPKENLNYYSLDKSGKNYIALAIRFEK